MLNKSIAIAGKVRGISEADATKLSAVALRGDTVLASSQVRPNGSYSLSVSSEAAHAESGFALQVAILPATAASSPKSVANAPRATIAREKLSGDRPIEAPHLAMTAELLDGWRIFWPEWCVSGTVVGPDGCPVPAADVTVYSVSWSTGGYTTVPRASVTTGPDGTFTLCFPWWDRLFPCWPCEPYWWMCWPWWWEWDILHVIDALETRVANGAQSVAVFRPDSRALIRGQGFAAAARPAINVQDPARTASIAKKFSNPALREIFPWWWWCCDGPNVTFGVTQGGTTIVPVDPSLDTHWCMESGQSVTLTGNSSALSLCPGGTLPEKGYFWTSVGIIPTTSIDDGGLAQAGGDNADVAFQGYLSLYAAVAPGAFKYYQVNAAVWDNLKRRGGTQPPPPGSSASAPVGSTLWLPVWIYDPSTNTTTGYNVQMGPFTANGYANLYATPSARADATLPTPPGLSPFPTIPSGGEVFWGDEGLVLTAQDMTLLNGAPFGGVDLTLIGFDHAFNPVGTEVPGGPLTLAIDSTGMTESVNGITAYTAPGEKAKPTGGGDCPAYDVGPNGFVLISVTAQDSNGFLCEYELQAQYGHDQVLVVDPPGLRGYVTNPTPAPTNPDYATATWVGGTETMMFPANPGSGNPPPDCCYEFRLYYSKRVTNGYDWPPIALAEGDFQTISLKFSS
jgi:hypothetical protein